MIEKIPISGGPHTGKTTLLEALKSTFPEAYFVPEPAENVIRRELQHKIEDPMYTPKVPWLDYTQFGPLVASESEALEAQIPPDTTIAFQDRSLIDTIAYSGLNSFTEFIPIVRQKVALAHYSFALLCDPVGKYTPTEIRRETAEEAIATHQAIVRAYEESGLEIVHLPAVSTDERVAIIADRLQEYTR